jgi:hypothetical protein
MIWPFGLARLTRAGVPHDNVRTSLLAKCEGRQGGGRNIDEKRVGASQASVDEPARFGRQATVLAPAGQNAEARVTPGSNSRAVYVTLTIGTVT